MTENNGSGKKEEVSFDGVVNELRNVLSGLGSVAPAFESHAAPAPAPAFNDPFAPPDFRGPVAENEFLKAAPPVNGAANGAPKAANGKPHAAPAPSEPLASDADFWNGNVLNWPSNGDADLADATSIGAASTQPAPSDNGFLREDAVENGFAAMPAPAESDFDKIAADGAMFLPPVPEPIEKSPEAWPLVKDVDDVIPAPPLAPAALPVTPPPAPPAEMPSADPWMRSGFGLDSAPSEPAQPVSPPSAPAARVPEFVIEPAASTHAAFETDLAPAPAAPAPVRPAADFEFELPIPGTKETRDAPSLDSGPHLDLDGTEMKPRDLIQVACVYPDGQEKAGQTFVTKLREAAEKLRLPMTIQAVFVSSWAPDKIEPHAWGKSASLSGADVMFVLAFRASGNLFRNLGEVAVKGGPKSRLVLLEQINFPTLYADVLVELRRAR